MAFRHGSAPYRPVELDVSIGRWIELPMRVSERPSRRAAPGTPARRQPMATGERQIVHDLMIIVAALALIGAGTRLMVEFERPPAWHEKPAVKQPSVMPPFAGGHSTGVWPRI